MMTLREEMLIYALILAGLFSAACLALAVDLWRELQFIDFAHTVELMAIERKGKSYGG